MPAQNDEDVYYGDPTGSLALDELRRQREDELSDRARRSQEVAMGPISEGPDWGTPGKTHRGVSNLLAAADAWGAGQQARDIEKERAADPFTGAAAQARVQKTQDALDAAALTMRPEIGEQAQELAKRNAFAEYLKSKGMRTGELEAVGSPAGIAAAETPYYAQMSDVGQQALDAANRREIQRAEAMKGALFGNLGAGTPTAPAQKLTPQEQMLVDQSKTAEQLIPELLSLYETDNPGITSDPKKFSSPTDMLGATIGGGLYKMGHITTENEARANILTGFLEAQLPRMLATGRINREQYADLKLHVPQVGLSAGANAERAMYIGQHLLPAVLGGVEAGRGMAPGSLGGPAPAAAPEKYVPFLNNRRDPNRGL